MIDEHEVILIEAEPPEDCAHRNFALRQFKRGSERAFVARQGYACAYLWTDEHGERLLTLCNDDKVE